jgi:hypothetical protein
MSKPAVNTSFYTQIVDLLKSARKNVLRAVNQTMVLTYFEVGRMIVEEEQNGKDRADYGKSLLQGLSKVLTSEFGKGFSVTNIQQMRNFYLTYQNQQTLSVKSSTRIQQTASAELDNKLQRASSILISETGSRKFDLSWSHYLILMRIDDVLERNFYEIEATKSNWSVRELQR